MTTYNVSKSPHLFPDVRAAVSALSALVNNWTGYQQYEISAVHTGGERAFAGFNVRVKDFDGFGVGYVVPVEETTAPEPFGAGPVTLTRELPDEVLTLARFATIRETEAYLNESPTIDQADLIAGRYGIDAPHGVGSDSEAVEVARRLGCALHQSIWDNGEGGTGISYYAILPDEDGRRPDDFDSLEAAALDALSVIEP